MTRPETVTFASTRAIKSLTVVSALVWNGAGNVVPLMTQLAVSVGCAWRIGAGGVGVADALGMDGAAEPRLRASGSWPEVLHLNALVRLHRAQGGDGVDASRRGDPRHRLERLLSGVEGH